MIGFSVYARLVCFLGLWMGLASVASARTGTDTSSDDGPAPPVPPAVVSRDAQGRVAVRAVRLEGSLTVDGRLDDSIYQAVPAISDFVQQEPREGEPATEKTEVWIFFDERNIYVTARMWDRQPERLVANEMRRDNNNVFQNDNFTVVFDTYRDLRSGFFFQTNALGALRDGLVTDEANTNYDWSTVWDVKSRRSEQGWTTEMAIPFKSLRYREGPNQVWGVNFRRVLRGQNEIDHLTRIPASYAGGGITKFSSAAVLVGLVPPGSAKNLELKPYAISQVTTNRTVTPQVSNELGATGGFDAKYGLTKSLVADFTFNTDFAQVEDDQQQVNLTRFSLFFPEKREFFLEGQGIFEFANTRSSGGGGGEMPVLFFSRAIGLNRGQRVPIRAGGRLTGRAGKYTIGFLNLQTGEKPEADATSTNFTIVRVKRDFLRRSNIGFIATRRAPTGAGAGVNTVAGFDANLSFYQDLEINSFYARTNTPGDKGRNASYRSEFNYNGDRYGLRYEHLTVEKDFNPEVGFLRREDFRRNYFGARFSPRPARIKAIRKLYYEAGISHIADGSSGALETRQGQGSFRMEMASGDRMDFSVRDNFEYLEAPFNIATGVVLPVGGYGFRDIDGGYVVGPKRKISGDFSVTHGGFYSGHRTQLSYTGRVELTKQFTMEPRISVNWVNLPEGRFRTTLLGSRTTFTMTPRMFVGALLQYNSSNHTFTTNVRFRWEYQPGSDLFVVYSEGRDTLLDGYNELQNRGFVIKYTRLFRF